MPLEFLAWSSPPLDFSRTAVKVILINITILLIIIVIIIKTNDNVSALSIKVITQSSMPLCLSEQ